MADSAPLEQHPFPPFMPAQARYLLIGTFPGRQLTQKPAAERTPEDWYYGTHKRSLWHILEQVYQLREQALPTVADRQRLLTELGLGCTDVVLSARRKQVSNRDADLTDVTFQVRELARLLQFSLQRLYFTSKLAQQWFNSLAGELAQHDVSAAQLTVPQHVLPSPSPEYIRFKFDTVEGRLAAYRQLLPVLG
ncbi:hypothetical protein GCM10027048_31820 [Hymenobacter coalescens]